MIAELPSAVQLEPMTYAPMSSGQKRLWFLQQLDPGSTAYNSVHQVILPISIAAETMRASVNALVRRHEMLRTCFRQRDDVAVQAICEPFCVDLPVLDLKEHPVEEREQVLRARINRLCGSCFDLEQAPLFRAELVRLGAKQDILLVQLHHIIADGESALIFLKELEALYGCAEAGGGTTLPRLALQYADYGRWQEEWLKSEAAASQLAYWRERLQDAPGRLELPTDDGPRSDSAAGIVPIAISTELLGELKALAQRHGVTLFMLLLAAFKALLFRYTGQQDIIVGSPVAARTRREFQDLIGFFVNTLPLRTSVHGENTFRELLGATRSTCLQAYGRQALPFDRIVEELEPERSLGTAPLFQVMLAMHRSPASETGSKWQFRDVISEQQDPQFDLVLNLVEAGSDLNGKIIYKANLFEQRRIVNMAAHYQRVLKSVVASCDCLIREIPILSEGETQQLVEEWNATYAQYPRELCLHELFERQAARAKDSTALVFGQRSMTYAELDRSAGRIAQLLQSRGVGPEVRVGLFLERSPHLVAAMLGVLKAGGAYVPLDPAYPVERISFILGDADIQVVIAEQATQQLLAVLMQESLIPTIVVDAEAAQGLKSAVDLIPSNLAPSNLAPSNLAPSNLAYVIYTSGSTGLPKGVAITHHNAVNFVCWAVATFEPQDLARVAAVTSVCFDLSVFEIFAPLSCGGAVLLLRDALEIAAQIANENAEFRPSLLNTVPSVAQQLLNEPALPSVRVLNLAGEAFTHKLWGAIRFRSFAERVFNLYGPSETTTYSIFASGDKTRDRAVPIGVPVSNTQVYVLDQSLQLLPVGFTGELFIGGEGVSRGYLNRPGMTAERLVPDLFGGLLGARLYRTGDLVRYRFDGQLEFLGRADHQVKIRGFRIELAEIEAVLQMHASVRQAVVIISERLEEKQIVGYVVSEVEKQSGAELTSGKLREYLGSKLPTYMVPDVFVFLDSLPLTANGKVDRAKLPVAEKSVAETEYTAPRTRAEQLTAEIWAELLGVERVGIHDHFFALGGHSLLASRAVLRMRQALEVEIPLRALFENPTIAQISEVTQSAPAETAVERLPRVACEEEGPYAGCYLLPGSFGQQRLWFLHELSEFSSVAYHVSGGLRIAGRLSAERLEQALGQVVEQQEMLRTGLAVVAGELRQVVRPQVEVKLPCSDLRGRDEGEQERELRALEDEISRRAFDLGRAPLLRVCLVRLGEERHVLLATAHHIVCDGWSVKVFLDELLQAYAGKRLREPRVQYAEFAHWQREWLESEAAVAQGEFWKSELRGQAPVLALPLDHARGALQTFVGATVSRLLPVELGQKLRGLGRRNNATLYMTLLAAFQVLLYRYSGETDVWVGTPAANRTRAEWANLIGFWANTLVMRTAIAAELRFVEVLERVRGTTQRAYAHQEYPFEKLVQELQPERDLSRTPLFQAMFALEEEIGGESRRAGLRLEPEAWDNGTAKFDLTLFMSDSESGLRARLEYNAELLEKATAERLLGHWERLLEAIAGERGETVAALPLLRDEERRELLEEWNATGREYAEERYVHECVAEWAERRPAAVAVVGEGRKLSYQELNGRANQLARYLREQGVGPEARVGICLERSPEMVVCALAVWKAGGAYVPLDAAYPAERLHGMLADMLSDKGGGVVLTQASLHERLAGGEAARLLCIDSEWGEVAGYSAGALDDLPDDPLDKLWDKLAYVIYTSGSTGQPKGVMVSHRNVNNLVRWHAEAFAIGPEDRGSCVAGLGFDASVWEVWPYLAAGASLAIPAEETRRDPEQLRRWLGKAGVTVSFVPTPLAEEMLRQSWRGDEGRLRTLLTGGDRLKMRPPAGVPWRLRNNYGPTEATVVASSGWVEAEDGQGRPAPSIGRPIGNTQLYVLDGELNPVPRGVTGELYIGGKGIARGYWNGPGMTAERFVPDAFGGVPGARLYRTGDLVRYRAEGEIEFIGRMDQQVKIRGFRVELGEIEVAISRYGKVRQAAVVAQGQGSEMILVAHVASAPGSLSASELRDFLAQRLPDYMMPAAYLFSEQLPLTANGKVDRAKLPVAEKSMADTEYTAPRTRAEQLTAEIWAELLGVERVGIHDHFFALGGHSLLASRAVLRMRNGLQSPLAIGDLFRYGTIAGLAERLLLSPVATSAAKRELPLVRLPRRPLTEAGRFAGCYVFPASPGQARLWFLHELNERSDAAYHVPGALNLKGQLQAEQLAEAINRVVARHESLRTAVAMVDGTLSQIVFPELRSNMRKEDIRGEHVAERFGQIAAKIIEEPFDLAQAPLVRTCLVHAGDEFYRLIVVAHHVICDGWSVGVFIRDLMEEYRGLVDGDRSRRPELAIQYADVAEWQSAWTYSAEAQFELEYWKDKLRGEAPLLNLPVDAARPAVQSYAGSREELMLPLELAESLRMLARAAGATMYMTLLSAFQVLLHKYSGQNDIWVGTPVANRQRLELEPLVGFFANTVVMRSQVDAEMTFSELLGRVRETVSEAFSCEQLSFERLVQELRPDRQLSTTPLFQVMFVMPENVGVRAEVCGLTIEPVMLGLRAAKFDVTLSIAEQPEGLATEIEYNTDLFERATIRRMLGHLEFLLRSIVAAPDRRIGELSLLTEQERIQILSDWNATEALHPTGSLHQLFEEQAAKTPEAIAVVSEGFETSFRELNCRANRLAHYLRLNGVGPEVRVAICMQRGLGMITALLGVLKTGGVYVPLDPSYPRHRQEWMLQDADACRLLTDDCFPVESLPCGVEVIRMQQKWSEIARQGDENPISRTEPGNLAYIIYTSGSTGTPKGVAITHASARGLMYWARAVFSDGELAGVLASTSICFDLSVFEIFAPLSWGGKVIVVRNALSLAGMSDPQQVRLVNTVPSAIAELLQMKALPSSVRTINLAGEALPRNLAEQIYQQAHIERVFNLYGPSEDTTYSTYEWVRSASNAEPVLIGRPIANTRVYVLDGSLDPVPAGVVGELYIAGEGQARGYLNRPDATAERFIPDPQNPQPGGRMYRTGDLARWKRNGSLEFLGRIDHQVKIRGFRIEMGEIESALLEEAGVKQAVAVTHGSGTEQRLIAYVVGNRQGEVPVSLNPGALRESLRSKLPAQVVPELIVVLPDLPLNHNGKVDRKQLPEPDRERDSGTVYVPPRNVREEILCGIFAQVLDVENVGIEDDFFQLGGHSLLATKVVSRVRSIFHGDLRLSDFFEAPTVAATARRIETLPDAREATLPLVAQTHEGDVPLSYAQQRLWFLDQLQPGSAAYNIAFGLRLRGELDRTGLQWSLNEIVRRHESLRTRFPLRSGTPVQDIAMQTMLDVEETDLAMLPREEREERLAGECRREAALPFDLQAGPLVRLRLYKLQVDDYALVITMHHIISDGWSLEILTREFMHLYQGWVKNEQPVLPPLKVQYADYSIWQRRLLQGEVLENELAYWRRQLAGMTALELPTDHPRKALATYAGGTCKVQVSPELTERLKDLSRQHGVTLFMMLVAAFQTVLGRYAGQEDVTIGTGIANRNHRDTESIIGFFVNTLVLRTDLSGNPSFIELLKRLRQVTLEAYQHQTIPFEKLVEELHPERDLSRTPLFQAMLMFQNVKFPELQLPGLRASHFEVETGAAKFDLILTLEERDGALSGELSYARELYEAPTIDRLAGHLNELLKRMVERPEAAIGDVGMLTHAERRQIVEDWNATETAYTRGRQLHELIEEQVERNAAATALICAGERLSYGELNRKANQVASYLRERGVGPDVRVGVCLERSVEMVVGLLAILKAGGVYVPLDPDYPAHRLSYMLTDAQPLLVLSQERFEKRLADFWPVPILCLDRDRPVTAQCPADNLASSGCEENLAYVIYTSGSTGEPKGAMIAHRGIVNRLLWMQDQYKLSTEDRVLQKTPFSFDVSVWEFFWPFLTGASLVICGPGRHGDSRYLTELIRREQVTTLHFVPSMLNQFLDDPEAAKCTSVRRVICSGEALSSAIQRRFFACLRAELHNLYGPTEASVDVTYWKCLPEDANRPVPIGRPVANTQIYVLDRNLNPVPVGVNGDLYIGGIQLARGYQNRPDLTAERFVPNWFSTSVGQRLYKTGDVARFRSDGAIEYLGRSDFQVKIHGFRIELGEIESALRKVSGIRDAAVTTSLGAGGDCRLVAYIVPLGAITPDVSELRTALSELLPHYMIPGQFVSLAELPLSQNGKLDRRALPEPGGDRPDVGQVYLEPIGAEEALLARIWCDVLGIERVGREDNFFVLGGDSIRSLQVITRARAQGFEITLQQLFQAPTVSGIARRARRCTPSAAAENIRPLALLAENDRAKLLSLLSRKASAN